MKKIENSERDNFKKFIYLYIFLNRKIFKWPCNYILKDKYVYLCVYYSQATGWKTLHHLLLFVSRCVARHSLYSRSSFILRLCFFLFLSFLCSARIARDVESVVYVRRVAMQHHCAPTVVIEKSTVCTT